MKPEQLTAWALNEKSVAVQQRRHAEENLAASSDAIWLALLETSELLGDRPNGQALQSALLKHAFPPLEKLIARYEADPRLRSQLAVAHRRLGELYHLKGEHDLSLNRLNTAVTLSRELDGRGRTPESVREQYEKTVRPSAEWFVYPTEKYADLVVSGEEPFDRSTSAVVAALHRARVAAR